MARNGGWSSPDVHVLAVDDSLVDRKVIERLLKITSCKVTAVESGWRALQYLGLLDQEKPGFVNGLKVDLIITDYCMPGMTGYELLKKIKGSTTFREVPVVIMSSENVVARIHRCLEEGAEDFIVKPVKLSDVKRLKDYMFGENNRPSDHLNNNKQEEEEEEEEEEEKASATANFNKRKLEDMSPSPSTSPSCSTSPTPQSPTSTSSSTPPLSPPTPNDELGF